MKSVARIFLVGSLLLGALTFSMFSSIQVEKADARPIKSEIVLDGFPWTVSYRISGGAFDTADVVAYPTWSEAQGLITDGSGNQVYSAQDDIIWYYCTKSIDSEGLPVWTASADLHNHLSQHGGRMIAHVYATQSGSQSMVMSTGYFLPTLSQDSDVKLNAIYNATTNTIDITVNIRGKFKDYVTGVAAPTWSSHAGQGTNTWNYPLQSQGNGVYTVKNPLPQMDGPGAYTTHVYVGTSFGHFFLPG